MNLNIIIGLISVITSCKSDQESDFISPPTTVKARENNTVLLPCYINTFPNDATYAKSIRWYKNDILIADSSNLLAPERYTLWENGSLEVITVQPSDTGEYLCEIERPYPWGTVKQKHAIEVMHSPSVTPFPLNGVLRVRLGEEVKMSCKGDGVPYPIITWAKKGKEMELLNHREVLKFTASNKNLAGTYECTAKNGVGEPARTHIDLHILYPPELLASKLWIHTAPEHRAQLECLVFANPKADVTWTKGEVPVPLDNRVVSLVEEDKHILLIRNVQASDFGIYTCKTANELGQAELHIEVSGVPNSATFKRTEDKNLNAKNSYTLIWEVDSFTPIIEYSLWFKPLKSKHGLKRPSWTKLTIPTENSYGSVYSKSYTIKGLKERTVYEALVVSKNRYGWSKPSSILRFATSGAELTEEKSTTIQISIEENIISEDFLASSAISKINSRIIYTISFCIYITEMLIRIFY